MNVTGETASRGKAAFYANIHCNICLHFDAEKKSCPCFNHVEPDSYACEHFQLNAAGHRLVRSR
jgi:hypothetical protein